MAHGGFEIVKALQALGANRAFCVAGESYLPVLDALVDAPEIELITCRHESGASFMAESYGALTGKPGIAMVTRGPGACNASIGVHTAMQASTPMILLVGLVRIEDRNKEAFQEFDIENMFGALAKWTAVVDEPDRLADYVVRAWHVAMSGRPGPVVIGLPEDVLFASQESFKAVEAIQPVPQTKIYPSQTDLNTLEQKLSQAINPLVILGGSQWSDDACQNMADFINRSHIPVTTSFRRQDVFHHMDKNYIGELGTSSNPKLLQRVKRADVILAVHTRLNEITTQGYTLFEPHQKIIHVYPEAAEFGKSYPADFAIQCDVAPFTEALAGSSVNLDGRNWASWRDEGRAAYLEWTTPKPKEKGAWNGADMTAIFGYLQNELSKDAIVTTDAGNFSGWAQRYLRYGRPGRLLAPVSGSMGYALPAAVCASLENPKKTVLGICGDGGFMMSSQVLATAAQYGAKPIILLCNNGVYGTIKMHQDKHYPERKSATDLSNPDFIALGQSYGAFTARVESADDFPEIWTQAINSGRLSIIEVVQDPKQATTRS